MSLEDKQYIVISYHWESLKEVKVIKEALEERGYCIRMELHNGEGSNARAMTENVDNSSAVLLCVTKAYKDSVNCNREASYADSRRKIIIPLKLDKDVKLDGWIIPLVEDKRCYDFHDSKNLKESAVVLDEELASLGVRKFGKVSTANSGQPSVNRGVDEVCDWLKAIEINNTTIEIFRANRVSGDDLLDIKLEELVGEKFKLRPFVAKKIIRNRSKYVDKMRSNESIGDHCKTFTTNRTEQTEEDVTVVNAQHQRVSEENSHLKLKKLRESICANICDQNIAFLGPAGYGKSATINTFYQALTGSKAPLAQEFPLFTAGTGKCSRYGVKYQGKTLYLCDTYAVCGYPESVQRCKDILSGKAFDEKSFSRRTLEWFGVQSNEIRIHCVIFIQSVLTCIDETAIRIVSDVKRMYGNGMPMMIIFTKMDRARDMDVEKVRQELCTSAGADLEKVFTLANYSAFQGREQKIERITSDEHVLKILDVIVKDSKSYKDG
ncbi:uncharacterized protein [Ptychodera flava]|uniref:uncharacterized protein n=1 Tax=Ptychodera flava TaxID=63121 RepID=UPI00396A2091